MPPRCCVGVVAGQPPAQVAVQRDAVEQRLQRIVGVRPSRRAAARVVCRERVGRAAGVEAVGLVVDDDEAVPGDGIGHAQHGVDGALQEPGEVDLEAAVGELLCVDDAAGRAAAGWRAAPRRCATRWRAASVDDSGRSKSSSARRSAAGMSARRRPSASGPSGVRTAANRPAVSTAGSTSRRSRPSCSSTSAARWASSDGSAGSMRSSTVCTSVPNDAPREHVGQRHRGRGRWPLAAPVSTPACGTAASWSGWSAGSSVPPDHGRRLRQFVLARAGDRRERPAPPRPIGHHAPVGIRHRELRERACVDRRPPRHT